MALDRNWTPIRAKRIKTGKVMSRHEKGVVVVADPL